MKWFHNDILQAVLGGMGGGLLGFALICGVAYLHPRHRPHAQVREECGDASPRVLRETKQPEVIA
jgi:hypothetical protein